LIKIDFESRIILNFMKANINENTLAVAGVHGG
jgi:hypothetical protein